MSDYNILQHYSNGQKLDTGSIMCHYNDKMELLV